FHFRARRRRRRGLRRRRAADTGVRACRHPWRLHDVFLLHVRDGWADARRRTRVRTRQRRRAGCARTGGVLGGGHPDAGAGRGAAGMALTGEGVLLRIFIGEADRRGGRPLSEVIVETARKRGLAGATAWKGLLGFAADSHMHTSKVLRLSTDLPVIIEIVDTREKIDAFLPELDDLVGEGLVTLERADVRIYRGPGTPRG